MFPVAVMVEPPPSLNVMSSEVFDAASAVIRSLIMPPAASANSFVSIYWVPSLGAAPAACLKQGAVLAPLSCRISGGHACTLQRRSKGGSRHPTCSR